MVLHTSPNQEQFMKEKKTAKKLIQKQFMKEKNSKKT